MQGRSRLPRAKRVPQRQWSGRTVVQCGQVCRNAGGVGAAQLQAQPTAQGPHLSLALAHGELPVLPAWTCSLSGEIIYIYVVSAYQAPPSDPDFCEHSDECSGNSARG